jgi:starch synthase
MDQDNKHIVMLAAENDSLVGGKVGGLADVIRDLPDTLADEGYTVTVITPTYGFLHKENPSTVVASVSFPFAGKTQTGTLYEVKAKNPHAQVTHLVFEHPDLRGTPIYSIDPPGQPFAQDATKFALFCSAIGQYLKSVKGNYIVHLHDWHTPTFLLLKNLHPEFRHLQTHKTVFTIHNLAYQGSRPFHGTYATVEQWFPELFTQIDWIEGWKDIQGTEPLYNPMATGIRFADKVNTVSPTYAEEILKTSNHKKGFYGGEGLETFLQQAKKEHRLFGIINACEYPKINTTVKISWHQLCDLILGEIKTALKEQSDSHLLNVAARVEANRNNPPSVLLTTVTRVNEQKFRLLFEKGSHNKTAITEILSDLESVNGRYILLGNGTPDYEEFFRKEFDKNERLIFIPLYSSSIATALYANGTLFLMPSSFEPCGISQMIAMREGQPCIVHAVGGLKDTVQHGVDGFRFDGNNTKEQVDALVHTTHDAIRLALTQNDAWQSIRKHAASRKFDWQASARQYIELLYKT